MTDVRKQLKQLFRKTGDPRYQAALEALDEERRKPRNPGGRPKRRTHDALLNVWMVVSYEIFCSDCTITEACKRLARDSLIFVGPERIDLNPIPNWETLRSWYHEAEKMVRLRYGDSLMVQRRKKVKHVCN